MGEQKVSTGKGKTKKLAEQQAAKYALEFFLKK
jgi:dsRNA-specific ribonuclease